MGWKWPYSCCFVGVLLPVFFFKIARSILVYFPPSFFSMRFVNPHGASIQSYKHHHCLEEIMFYFIRENGDFFINYIIIDSDHHGCSLLTLESWDLTWLGAAKVVDNSSMPFSCEILGIAAAVLRWSWNRKTFLDRCPGGDTKAKEICGIRYWPQHQGISYRGRTRKNPFYFWSIVI